MPKPFPGLFEVSGEQRVPELRSELSKNTSLAWGVGGWDSSKGGCQGSYLVGTLGHFDDALVSDPKEHHSHTHKLSSYLYDSPLQVEGILPASLAARHRHVTTATPIRKQQTLILEKRSLFCQNLEGI